MEFIIEFDTGHPFFNQKRSLKDEFGFPRKVKYVEAIPELDPFINKNLDYFIT